MLTHHGPSEVLIYACKPLAPIIMNQIHATGIHRGGSHILTLDRHYGKKSWSLYSQYVVSWPSA